MVPPLFSKIMPLLGYMGTLGFPNIIIPVFTCEVDIITLPLRAMNLGLYSKIGSLIACFIGR